LAWRQLLEEPDELLIETFANKVESLCGYEPEIEILTEFIHKSYISSQAPIQPIQPNPYPPSKKKLTKTPQKGAIASIGEWSINASTVGDLYYQALKYICDKNYIQKAEDQIPFATSAVRYLIAKEPIHQRGNGFRVPIEYQGYYMEAHKNYEQAFKQLEDFLRECGLELKY